MAPCRAQQAADGVAIASCSARASASFASTQSSCSRSRGRRCARPRRALSAAIANSTRWSEAVPPQCTPAGGRGDVPSRAVLALLPIAIRRLSHDRSCPAPSFRPSRVANTCSTTTSPSRAQPEGEHGFGGGRRRAARKAGEDRRVQAPRFVGQRGGTFSCGERGIRTLGRVARTVQ